MSQEHDRKEQNFSRREFILWLLALFGIPALGYFGYKVLNESEENPNLPDWPSDEEGIFNKIKELDFLPGSHLQTTVFFRKIAWEMAKSLESQKKWTPYNDQGIDMSDWEKMPELMEQAMELLVQAGIKGGRLVVVPYELTEDGQTFNWEPLEKAIELMDRHNMEIELCVGPFNYPYDPGARLPVQLREMLVSELETHGEDDVEISLGQGPRAPESSVALREFGLNFIDQLLERYADDERIGKFSPGNEWPNRNGVEYTDVTMTVSQDFMMEIMRRVKNATTKPILLNTNIHASDHERLEQVFGELLDLLGEQGVLGFDLYPTREAEIPELRAVMDDYPQMMEQIREVFPQTTLVTTEHQFEWFGVGELAGKSWAEIYSQRPDIIEEFYYQHIPSSFESHIVGGGFREVGLWGAPAWIALAMIGEDFPIRMLVKVNEQMERRSG